ncbi:hypothetical protein [Paenibacillus sp. FSL H8-0259]|uniref:hypothetical protein n=1 Tax=Paenibacillus sp. FSL H8-0259 TaxID=1920423 RepID=UPI00096F9E18|nr:hypothetical protein [Paenibacillus sp. FSL H8-0259]OMF30945.1 hypothetical protein BK132_05815 [Paenibacillus sp. FSL H8-0259]
MSHEIKTDSSKQEYIEIETVTGVESLRVTYVKDGFTGKPCIRLNIRPHGKSPRPGPEFDIEHAPDLLSAIAQLLMDVK